MAVTLADIARELGVSQMTVSRAINNNPLIKPHTREWVLAAARRMNYHPNQHARALATNRSYLIGVVVPDLMNLYFVEVIHAVESVARQAGFQLLICNTNEDAGRELSEVNALLHRTDGLIVSSVEPQSWWVNGGPGRIVFDPRTKSLIVSQTAEIHYMLSLGKR